MSQPLLVVFDWGGVVLKICRSWSEGCDRAGLPVHEADLDASASAARAKLAHAYQLGEIDCDRFCESISDTTDGRLSASDVARLHDAWLIEEYPGMAELIDQLHSTENVRTGLLSNTNAGHWRRHLPRPDGSPPDFPTVGTLNIRLGSHILRQAKPDKAIYRSMEQQSGVPASRIVFFDDLAENVSAARTLGWRAEQVDHEGDPASQIRGHLVRMGVLK